MADSSRHPDQPKIVDNGGVVRFKANPIVRFLLEAGQFNMNSLSLMPWKDGDRAHFAQLIGYSVSSFGGLSYADEGEVARHDDEAAELLERGS